MQFAALKGETIMQVRICCINQVLGTDMKKHFDITSRFQASLLQSQESGDMICMFSRLAALGTATTHVAQPVTIGSPGPSHA